MCWPVGARRRVDHAGLGHQAEGPFGVAAGRHLGLAGGHLLEVPPDVDGHRLAGTPSASQGTGPSSAQSTLQTPGP